MTNAQFERGKELQRKINMLDQIYNLLSQVTDQSVLIIGGNKLNGAKTINIQYPIQNQEDIAFVSSLKDAVFDFRSKAVDEFNKL